MITVTATAHCIGRCEWTAGPGDWAATDRAAEAHTRKACHPTATEATPANTTTGGQRP
jgi:hypothetical protein